MKATFFSIAALAASAFAAPLVGEVVKTVETTAGGAVAEVHKLPVRDVGSTVGSLVGGGNSSGSGSDSGSGITDVAGLTSTLKGLLSSVMEHTGSINKTVASVSGGDLDKDQALKIVYGQVTTLHTTLTGVTATLGGITGIDASGEVDEVFTVVAAIVNELVSTVNGAVGALGLTAVLNSLLGTVFSLVATLLALVGGLLGNVLPELLTVLGPILATVTGGPLAGLLGPVTGILGGGL